VSVEHVDHRNDPSRQWDLLTGEAAGVAPAVPALVMGERDPLG
jgi:hypothetical protein